MEQAQQITRAAWQIPTGTSGTRNKLNSAALQLLTPQLEGLEHMEIKIQPSTVAK